MSKHRQRAERDGFNLWIVIDGELFEVYVQDGDTDGEIARIETVRGLNTAPTKVYTVAADRKTAGRAARTYYSVMVNAREERAPLLAALAGWLLGKAVEQGTTTEWMDMIENHPEAHFAPYDGCEQRVEECSKALCDVLGFVPTVCYRSH